MGSASKIEWTGASWTPIRARNTKNGRTGWHCVHMTEACRNCYAEAFNKYIGTGLPYKPGHLSNGDVEMFLDEKMLLAPLRWKKPRKIFVCSMTDLFGDFVQEEWIDRMYAVMALCPQHTFQVLTKRPDRMAAYHGGYGTAQGRIWSQAMHLAAAEKITAGDAHARAVASPLRNVWHGTSICDQADADASMPHLVATPSVIRFVSHEPALGLVDWSAWLSGIDQIIDGGESGPKARPSTPDIFRANRDQCVKAGIFYFHKQNGAYADWRQLDAGSWEQTTPQRPSYRGPILGRLRRGGDDMFGGRSFPTHIAADWMMVRVGKKAAGAMLDGREWREMPS